MQAIDAINSLLVPIRLIIPQPIVSKLPILRTNEEERFRRVLKECNGHLLDIGCGNNTLVKQYRLSGYTGVGVDVYDWGGPDYVVSDTANLPFNDLSFDTITFVACFNHIPNRVEVLHEVRRLLKPKGQLILTNLTPKLSLLWHKYAYWDDDQNERGMEEGEVYGFSDRELTNIAFNEGFVLKKRKRFLWGLNNLYVFSTQ